MKTLRLLLTGIVAIAASIGFGQSWSGAYDTGLKAARATHWVDARAAFLQAAAIRAEDVSQATTLPGPITERRQWRNGAPYSPNFLAAYSAYRSAVTVKDLQAQTAIFHTVAEEMQTLIDKGQISPATAYYLNAVYTRLGESDKARALIAKINKPGAKWDWKVDTEVVDPQELAQIDQMVEMTAQSRASSGQQPSPTTDAGIATSQKTIKAGQQPGAAIETGNVPAIMSSSSLLGPVMQDPNKYALLIGNGEYRLPDGRLPYAADDAQKIRESLLMNAGYLESNVDLVLNATSDQIRSSAKALADRVNQDSVILLFFTGIGTNVDGKDYLVGSEAESLAPGSSLVAKNELYQMFMSKGARIFAFYQANRPIKDGRYFGMEIPMVGSIAQSQATMPGDTVNAFMKNGKELGIYADAFASVLGELRTNRVSIGEFGWQVFYKVRRGNTGTTGGGSRQTPTLPVLTNMAADARF